LRTGGGGATSAIPARRTPAALAGRHRETPAGRDPGRPRAERRPGVRAARRRRAARDEDEHALLEDERARTPREDVLRERAVEGTALAHEHIRVLCVDDHPLMREGLTALINDSPDMTVVAEATNG